MNNPICTLVLCCLIPGGLFSQALTRKEANQAAVKSISEYETSTLERKAKPVLESFTRYDEAGNLLEIIERDNSGTVILHESYEFNADGQKTSEIQYEPDGKIKKKHVYKYVNGLRAERLTYDKNGTLITQKKYVYEFHQK